MIYKYYWFERFIRRFFPRHYAKKYLKKYPECYKEADLGEPFGICKCYYIDLTQMFGYDNKMTNKKLKKIMDKVMRNE